jgi:hypothetical protein
VCLLPLEKKIRVGRSDLLFFYIEIEWVWVLGVIIGDIVVSIDSLHFQLLLMILSHLVPEKDTNFQNIINFQNFSNKKF